MAADCWTDKDYQFVLNRVRHHLWLYVHRGATIEELSNAVENLTQLTRKDLEYLAVVHFLLSDVVKDFVEIISRIFRRISHSTRREVIISRGCVRGRIDWAQTLKERCSQGYDNTIFVCTPAERVYNLPENQLLKYVLVSIRRMIEETRGLPKVEEKNVNLEELKTEDGRQKWTDRISWIRFHINRALKHSYLRGVETPNRVSSTMMRRARTARNREYQRIADTFSLHEKSVQRMDRETLRELIEKRVLQPREKDALYELFVLFEVMELLGEPEDINLVRPGAKSIGTFRIGKDIVHIYFQKVSGVFEESKYKEIFEDYELDVSLRRPDLILQFVNQERFLLIEVKRTTNPQYTVDSVYKVLGYIADFEKYFGEKQKPKGVLVVWDIKRLGESEQDVTILGHNDIGRITEEVVKRDLMQIKS